MKPSAADLLAVLPQTQCTRCGYPDCAAYAQAIAQGQAAINQCPPGGNEGVQRLSALTGLPAMPLTPEHGLASPRTMAFIDEAWCIGCTLCIKACPVDAIFGANKHMHTVLEAHCTGCELCLPVCPVDCIELENASGEATGWQAWSAAQADQAKARYAFHNLKTEHMATAHAQRLEQKALIRLNDLPNQSQHLDPVVLDQKRAVIEAALARARAKKSTQTT